MIIIMGVAGAGKSVQGQMLANDLGCKWVSTGNILRQYITDERRERMLAGELMDDREIIPMLDTELSKLHADDKECILDGFPRSLQQAEWLISQAKAGVYKITGVVHLEVPKEVVKKRLLLRGRMDDTETAIAERFREYDNAIVPILHSMEQEGFEVLHVDGSGNIADIHHHIMQQLKRRSSSK